MPHTVSDSDLRRVGINQTKRQGTPASGCSQMYTTPRHEVVAGSGRV